MTTSSLTVADLAPWPNSAALGADPSCKDHPDPDLWFPDPSDDPAPAVRVCNGCPVRDFCFATASVRKDTGVWGGVNMRRGVPTGR